MLETESQNSFKTPPNDKGFIVGLLHVVWNDLRVYGGGVWALILQWFMVHRKLTEIPKRSGDIAVLTGGTRGIGQYVLKDLLRADLHVIVGYRDISLAEKVLKNIRQSGVSTGTVQFLSLDLKSFCSVRKFADDVIRSTKYGNILINNAGVMFAPYELTKDGMDVQFQVNYFSHFLLTHLLLQWLIGGGQITGQQSRIINVSSTAHYNGRINFDDLVMKKFHCRVEAYSNSKLMQVVGGNYLNNMSLRENWPLRIYAVHPGVVDTNLFQYAFLLMRIFTNLFNRFLSRNPQQGADCVVFTALAKEDNTELIKYGYLLSNCIAKYPNPIALNQSTQAKLWKMSSELVHVDPNLSKVHARAINNDFINCVIDME